MQTPGELAQALKAHESALAIRKKLADASPTVTAYQAGLATVENNIGKLLRAARQDGRGFESVPVGVGKWQIWLTHNPAVVEFGAESRKATTTSECCSAKQAGRPRH